MATAALTFFSGFGLGTLLMPVLAVFFPVEVAIAATALVHLANNIFKMVLVGRQADWRVVAQFAIPGAVAAAAGATLLDRFVRMEPWFVYSLFDYVFAVEPVKLVIAFLILIFSLIELTPAGSRLSFDKKLIPVGGVLSGFFGGLSGHQGALRSAFLIRLGLSKKALIGTMIVSAVVVDVLRLIIYGTTFFKEKLGGLREGGELSLVIVSCLAAFVGSFASSRLLGKVTLQGVQRLIAVLLVLLALALGAGII